MSGGKTVWNMAALDLRGVSVSKFSLSDVASQNDSDLSKGYYFIRSSVDCSFKIDADPVGGLISTPPATYSTFVC